MRHVCIKCGVVWLPDHEDDDGDITSDLCEECLMYWIRGKQITEGHHDCYRRAVEICSKGKKCKWFQMCCESLLIEDMLEEYKDEGDVRT
jgi:hypothetical protein